MIIGIDIGGTKIATVLGSPRGEIVRRTQFPTQSERGFSAVFEDIVTSVRQLRDTAVGHVEAISISVGGPLDINGVINSPPNLPGWDAVPLKQMIAERTALPVFIEHDGNAGALAEFYFGAGKGFQNIVFLTMGTGLGAGLIINGKLYRGTTNVAGEIGHIRIAEYGPASYGKAGSLEGYGSGTGIAKLAHMMFPSRWSDAVTALDVYEQYTSGSADALAVFDRAALHFGRGLAMLADLLNPEKIILGGIGMRMIDALVEPAKRVFHEEVLPEAGKACEIVPARLGESIGDVASLCAAIDQGGVQITQ